MDSVLKVQGISKAYGTIQALSDVSFHVPTGSVFGILGPNGSGKTTLLGILLHILQSDSGNYSWFDEMPSDQARQQIGSLLETPNFYHYLSAYDNLKIAARIKRLTNPNFDFVLKTLGLYDRRNSAFQTFSLGMKQRLALASALLGKPKILVLDEPTNGLDPNGIAEIRDLIGNLHHQGITVIMASHLLDEVEKVCTHVAVLKKGNLLLSGKVDEVFRSTDQIEISSSDLNALSDVLKSLAGINQIQQIGDRLLLHCNEQKTPQAINEYCAQNGIYLSHLAWKKKSLERKFMELINENQTKQ
ncbi:MAG: ABC transporter ATP-binding protein [Bacteroidetes bacterium]|nr:ABC transporter ATP-binding protein [Bacteroidota bacterium]